MKLLVFVLFISIAYAKNCYQLEVVAKVSVNKDHLIMTLAEGTQSSRQIAIPQKLQGRFAPYLNSTIKASLILEEKTLKEVSEIDHAIPDPLNQNAGTVVETKGKVKCP